MFKSEYKAPKGQFMVVAVDDAIHHTWIVGYYCRKQTALLNATKKGGPIVRMDVYDDKGKRVHTSAS